MRLQYPEVWLDLFEEVAGSELKKESNRERILRVLMDDLTWASSDGRVLIRGVISQLGAITRHFVSHARLLRMKKQLAAQGAPILLVVGDEDLLVPVGNSYALRKVLECPVEKIEASAHMLHYQMPYAFNKIIQKHLDSASSSSPSDTSSPSSTPKAKL